MVQKSIGIKINYDDKLNYEFDIVYEPSNIKKIEPSNIKKMIGYKPLKALLIMYTLLSLVSGAVRNLYIKTSS